MKIIFKKKFAKTLDKQPENIKEQAYERIKLFLVDPNHSILRNHQLTGPMKKYRSINLSGDIRAIYIYHHDHDLAIFYFLGTHSKLYG